jgi:hypothetical protein
MLTGASWITVKPSGLCYEGRKAGIAVETSAFGVCTPAA